MKLSSCIEVYDVGYKYNKNYPRTQGAYKLAERLRQWEEYEREVERITSVVTNQSSRYDLQHCTYEDMDVWLHEILKHIAYELDVDIIPSFKALTGDGMSETEIKRYLPQVIRLCRNTLRVLERAHQSIKGPIQDEYDRMHDGHSVVGDALRTARQTLEAIVNVTPLEIQNYIYPSVQEVN